VVLELAEGWSKGAPTGYIKGAELGQQILFPPTVDEYIEEEKTEGLCHQGLRRLPLRAR
jgi:hypothetical protein